MRARRGREEIWEPCAGPARLTQALDVSRDLDGADRATATRSGSSGGADRCRGRRSARRGPRGDAVLALLDRGGPVRVPRPSGSAYAEGDGEGSSGSVHDTVIVTVLVWNASVPAAGFCMITVPFGCVDGAVVTST